MRNYRVFYYGSDYANRGRGRAGREVAVNRRFCWDGDKWLVPSVYICHRGLVVELFKRVEREELDSFMKKYGLDESSDGESFSEEMRMNIERENPLNEDVRVYANLNGDELSCAFSSLDCLSPLDADCDSDIKQAIAHYGLDKTCCWLRVRASLPLKQKCRRISALSLTLKSGRTPVPGIHFAAEKPGDSVEFDCPTDGKRYTLTVASIEKERLRLVDEDADPAYFSLLNYTVSPELPRSVMSVVDLSAGAIVNGIISQHDCAASVGVIGGADGPTVIASASRDEEIRTACSCVAMYDGHKPDWFIRFFLEPKKDITLRIM